MATTDGFFSTALSNYQYQMNKQMQQRLYSATSTVGNTLPDICCPSPELVAEQTRNELLQQQIMMYRSEPKVYKHGPSDEEIADKVREGVSPIMSGWVADSIVYDEVKTKGGLDLCSRHLW